MTQTLERHELEDLHREQQDYEQTLKFEAWRQDSLFVIKDALEKGTSLEDAINTISLDYDEYDSPTDKEINEIVIEVVRGMK